MPISLSSAVFYLLLLLPLASAADDSDQNSPAYKDAATRYVMSISMPFELPAANPQNGTSLQIRKACARGQQLDAQVYHGLLHFDLSSRQARYESFPFQILDMTCGDDAHRHLLVTSWPEHHIYSISIKPQGAWSGWRRNDEIKLPKGEAIFGFVEGEDDVQILTGHHLVTLKGDAVAGMTTLSRPLNVWATARIFVVRVNDDIYFGNDGGEWGGTLYRVDGTNGKISLEDEGAPVVSITPDPTHVGCVLVARAVSHMGLTDGGLMRACHDTATMLIEKKPVWAVTKTSPPLLAFSDGLGELQESAVINQRAFPSSDEEVAGLHFATLTGLILLRTGITQSVSVSGAVPMLVDWKEQPIQ